MGQCVNLTFTYDPERPSIQPLQGLTVCPHNLTTHAGPAQVPDGRSPHRERPKMDRVEEELHTNSLSVLSPRRAQVTVALQRYYLLRSRRLQREGGVPQDPAPLLLNVTLDIVSSSVGKTILGIEADSPTVE